MVDRIHCYSMQSPQTSFLRVYWFIIFKLFPIGDFRLVNMNASDVYEK